ncbi:MAG: AAA family ATPase, partial [Clostridia bacterium]|nr:AAA family ATPase [Clostridia bacterium]
MGKIITFANQKGGVGKTTSAVNVAASLGILGKKVLLCDLDPQGNTTSGVGVAKKSLKYTTAEVLLENVPVKDAIIETKFKNLSVIPANISLAGSELDLFQVEN